MISLMARDRGQQDILLSEDSYWESRLKVHAEASVGGGFECDAYLQMGFPPPCSNVFGISQLSFPIPARTPPESLEGERD